MITVLKHSNILTCDTQIWSIEPHCIVIEDSEVLGLDLECVPDRTVDLDGALLLPALFNLHCHLGESLYDTTGSDWTISKYLAYTADIVDNMTPSERDLFWHRSAEKTIRLLLENGTGGFCAARSAEVARKHCICTMSGYPLMRSQKLEQYYKAGFEGFSHSVRDARSPYSSAGIFLHSLYKADEALLCLAAECFENGAEFLTVHISEDSETRQMEMARFHQEPVFVLNQLGLLTERTILVHGGYLSREELSLVHQAGALIAVCPISNQFLNTVCIDIYALEEIGIQWCLATDGLATGRTLSLIDQATVLKAQFPLIPNIKLLQSMTTIPAQAFRRSVYTGKIETGTQASFLLLPQYKTNVEDTLEALFTGESSWQVIRF